MEKGEVGGAITENRRKKLLTGSTADVANLEGEVAINL